MHFGSATSIDRNAINYTRDTPCVANPLSLVLKKKKKKNAILSLNLVQPRHFVAISPFASIAALGENVCREFCVIVELYTERAMVNYSIFFFFLIIKFDGNCGLIVNFRG